MMENFENLKLKLIQTINECTDRDFIFNLWNVVQNNKNTDVVREPSAIYGEEKPMTEEEVEEYFREEKVVLPPEILEILKLSEEDIKAGRTYTNEEVQEYFDEWLKN